MSYNKLTMKTQITAKAKGRFEKYFKQLKKGCWIWRGSNNEAYGQFSCSGRTLLAHRFAYTIYIGKIPARCRVKHKCKNKMCVNPAHLFLDPMKPMRRD
jgi:hypothetical protein